MKLKLITYIALAIFLVACSSEKKLIGKWSDVNNSKRTMVIEQKDDVFVANFFVNDKKTVDYLSGKESPALTFRKTQDNVVCSTEQICLEYIKDADSVSLNSPFKGRTAFNRLK